MTYEIAHDYGAEPGLTHQLSPLKGGRYTRVFHGPPGTEVGDLHCDLEPFVMGDTPVTINHSGWHPTEEQVRQLESGAHVRLTVWQHPIPPLSVSIEPPVCECHHQAMAWNEDESGYQCQMIAVSAAPSSLEEARARFTPEAEE